MTEERDESNVDRDIIMPSDLGEFTESRREAFSDDIIVSVRLRPGTIARLAEGLEVRYVRLDQFGFWKFDLYLEFDAETPDHGEGVSTNGVKGSPTLEAWAAR